VTINRTGQHRTTSDCSRRLSSCFWCAEVFSRRVAALALNSVHTRLKSSFHSIPKKKRRLLVLELQLNKRETLNMFMPT